MCYLAEGTELLPGKRYGRAQVMQWLFFEQYSHEPYIAVPRFWAIAGIEVSPQEAQAKRRGGEVALRALERHLATHSFLVAERYMIADIALYAYTHVAPRALPAGGLSRAGHLVWAGGRPTRPRQDQGLMPQRRRPARRTAESGIGTGESF